MRTRERGFALIVVLWSLGLLALLTASLLSAARGDARLTTNRRAEASATAAADAALSAEILDLIHPGGTALARLPAARGVVVTVEDLSGRLNPNIASAAMLHGLLVGLGIPEGRALALAAAIVDWRSPTRGATAHGAKAPEYRAAGLGYGPPSRPFTTLDELDLVLGMTPDLAAALRPHMTLWTSSDPDPAVADALVLAALRDGGVPLVAGSSREARVVALTATANWPDAPHVRRRAIVRLGYSPDGRVWRVLDWDDGESPPD